MKILHINVADHTGGADIACMRHCEAMRAAGYDARMLVVEKQGSKSFIRQAVKGRAMNWHRVLCHLYRRIIGRLHPVGNFSVMCFGHPLHRRKEVLEADVLFLHWVNNNTLSLKGVSRILKLGKPTFWFMHDMFPISGGCHHALQCKGYQSDCRDCPMIGNASWRRIAERQLRKKLSQWSRFPNLSFITPSQWLADCVRKSPLAKGHPLYVVPNVIDTQLYRPLPKDSKALFGLDPKKKTILLGASSMQSMYKGMRQLRECLMMLDPDRYEGLVIGDSPDLVKDLPIRIKQAGYLFDDLSLVLAYNACDTFVISSVAENYPNVVLEAMSCGKPCVGYNTGGIPELIRHGQTGYITPVNTPEALVEGIEYLFADEVRYRRWSLAARHQIEEKNAYQAVKTIHTELSGINN